MKGLNSNYYITRVHACMHVPELHANYIQATHSFREIILSQHINLGD